MIEPDFRGKGWIVGYGNPGRQDDGLGPEAIRKLREWNLPDVFLEDCYCLNLEDAQTAKDYDFWIFIDAAISEDEPFRLTVVLPQDETSFSTHILRPETLLAICQKFFGTSPRSYLLTLRGYEFEFEEGLTEKAQLNLQKALDYLRTLFHKSIEKQIIATNATAQKSKDD
ncbi:hydrogenase maturation protease [Telmatocola sphagniphila]|uniref:Hydrogenase maturation protease n=1 Tax=Telmatocola sphagniphila TaxID=1123043 RepID=A0A8E6B8V5_9BACT|nr:hydrogenase maturation protease [Telmatocola sphagniphila]QVL33512.1 hydrogenase maturation protease [Telmatocola sphagniphila]